jgi:hypothetical protein
MYMRIQYSVSFVRLFSQSSVTYKKFFKYLWSLMWEYTESVLVMFKIKIVSSSYWIMHEYKGTI